MFAEGGLEKNYVPAQERGVVFLSSIPSNMRPNEVRLHLQQYGTIFRTKFTAFPKKDRSSGHGIMPLQFKNGYVEFIKKDDAIRCADTLNGQMVATKKRRKSHGQIWNIRFMEGFSMGDLAEEREEQTRNRKEMEHRIKEREKSANELFRQMVMQKKNETQLRAASKNIERSDAEAQRLPAARRESHVISSDAAPSSEVTSGRGKRDRSEARRPAANQEATPVDVPKKRRVDGTAAKKTLKKKSL
jgi:ESF2/ABP1 family protein